MASNPINRSNSKSRAWIVGVVGLLAFAGVLAVVIVLAKPSDSSNGNSNINSVGKSENSTSAPTTVVADRSIPFTGGADGYVSDPTAAGCQEFPGVESVEISNNTICEDTLIHYDSMLEDLELPNCNTLYQVSENAMALVAACQDIHYIVNKRQSAMFVFNRTQLQDEDVEGSRDRRNLGSQIWDYGYFFLVNAGTETVGVQWSEDVLGQFQENLGMFDCRSGQCDYENNQFLADYLYTLRVAPGGIGVVYYKRRFCDISTDGDTQIQMFTYAESTDTRDVWFAHNTEVPTTMANEVTSTQCAAPDFTVSGCVYSTSSRTGDGTQQQQDVKSCFESTTNVCDSQTLGICGVQTRSRDYTISCELQTAPGVGSAVYMNAVVELDTTLFEAQDVTTCYT